MKVNLNDKARIKLTKKGVQLYRAYYEKLGLNPDHYQATQMNSEGWYEDQLWQVMLMFGPSIHMGFDLPFETNFYLEPCGR